MEMLRKNLDALLRQGAKRAGVELYHWELRRTGQRARLLVYIDHPEGVTLADCARTSRAIDALLEEMDPIPAPYVLEVSSPGIERKLWEPWHYQRAVGKRVRVILRTPQGDKRGLGGVLRGVEGERIALDCPGEQVTLPLAEVIHAQVVFDPEER
jgi:ribosome maturation factor RimP